MFLTGVVTKEELAILIESLTPMRITLDERRGRTVTIGRPQKIELVAKAGLRLRGDARIQWDVAGVAFPVTVQAWQVMLVPRIATRARSPNPKGKSEKSARDLRVLQFEPVIEELDLRLVPGFLDDKIASAIRDGLVIERDRIAWDFARTLSKRLAFPTQIAPSRLFEIRAVDGGVIVTETELRLTIRLEARIRPQVQAQAQAQAQAQPEGPQQGQERTSGNNGFPPMSPVLRNSPRTI